jgi:prevent-host-death family protein
VAETGVIGASYCAPAVTNCFDRRQQKGTEVFQGGEADCRRRADTCVVYTAYTTILFEGTWMARYVSAREARARFAELTDRVRYTGESVIVEKQGHPFVALVSLEDFALLERLRQTQRAG